MNRLKKILGIILIVIGLLALVTPLTPGSWLIPVGLGMLGVPLTFWDRFKQGFKPGRRGLAVACLCLIFTTWFLYNTKSDLPLIFKKDLLAHDESSNSVVAANITRKFFPPMVRVNPLDEKQGIWMEGPHWQHIPPLFAYIPYPFFKMDGQVTIELKRLAFAFYVLLTGLIFIVSVYKFKNSLLAAAAATVAALFWINTPFTHELITGYAFGVSDIVLAFTVVCGFGGILWYLKENNIDKIDQGREEKILELMHLGILGVLVALPILAKNLLGAIPAATFFILLIIDYSRTDKLARYKLLVPISTFLSLLILYYLPQFLVAPDAFKTEIILPLQHFGQLEGWERPWHWFVTNYLPQRYLFRWSWVYFAGLIGGVAYLGWRRNSMERSDRILLMLSGGWFLWNLIAISLVTSKVPNFIYQSYLLSLFFIGYALVLFLKPYFQHHLNAFILSRNTVFVALIIFALATGYEGVRFILRFNDHRAQAYNYQTDHEKFYQLAEKLRDQGVDQRDLVIVHNPPKDCWERYYIIFVTGAESKTLLQLSFNKVPKDIINAKYRDVVYVDPTLVAKKIEVSQIDEILKVNQTSIDSEIIRIKADKTSCQWLVPDTILNGP